LGGSTIAGPNGDILAYLDSEGEGVITAELFNDEIIKARATAVKVFNDRRPDLYGPIVEQLTHASLSLVESTKLQSEIEREGDSKKNLS
jgi:hypothetical protein